MRGSPSSNLTPSGRGRPDIPFSKRAWRACIKGVAFRQYFLREHCHVAGRAQHIHFAARLQPLGPRPRAGASITGFRSSPTAKSNSAHSPWGRVSAVEFTTQRDSREGVGGYLRGLTDAWEMIRYDVEHLIAQGDRVVMIGSTSWRYKANGKSVDTPKVDSWRFNGDGQVTRILRILRHCGDVRGGALTESARTAAVTRSLCRLLRPPSPERRHLPLQ